MKIVLRCQPSWIVMEFYSLIPARHDTSVVTLMIKLIADAVILSCCLINDAVILSCCLINDAVILSCCLINELRLWNDSRNRWSNNWTSSSCQLMLLNSYSLVEPKLIDLTPRLSRLPNWTLQDCWTIADSWWLIAPTHWIAKLQQDLAGAISSSIDWITIIVNFKVVSL